MINIYHSFIFLLKSQSAEYDDADNKKPKLWNLARSITKRVSKLKNNEVAPMPQNTLAPPEPTATADDSELVFFLFVIFL